MSYGFSRTCLVLMLMVLGVRICHGGRVLLAPQLYKSHIFEMAEVGRGLVDLGHEVYFVAVDPFPLEKQMLDYGFTILYYHVPDNVLRLSSREHNKWVTKKVIDRAPMSEITEAGANVARENCFHMMQDKQFLDKIKSLNFDIAIYGAFILTECMVILPYHLDIPYVYQFAAFPVRMAVSKLTPAFSPAFNEIFSDHMSLWQRVQNLFLDYQVYRIFLTIDQNTTLLQHYGHGAKSWSEVTSRSALFLITRDYLMEWPRATLPNMIVTPGLTQRDAKPLPLDIEKMVDTSENNVILMTMGSIAQLDAFPSNILNNFFSAFIDMDDFLFLCKFQVDVDSDKYKLLNIPPNVKIMPWLPQNDLLGHPKTKLFITHGGNNGQHEAVYHGVPMITFPLFTDQHKNAFRTELHNIGIVMDLFTFKPADLIRNIRTILDDNNDYLRNIKHKSAILHSFPEKPRDKMAFWVDHVMQFGSHHLYSPAQEMSFIEIMMVDVMLILLAVFVLVGFSLYWCCIKIKECATSNKLKQS